MSTRQSLGKERIRFLLLEGIHAKAVDYLKADGYTNIGYFEKSLPPDQLEAELAQAHFVGIRSNTQLTAELLAKATKLNAVGCFCIGTNQVDLDAAQGLGIPVFNAPFANTRSVAELVLGEIILLLRRVPEKSAAAHRGEWQKAANGCFEARGKTLGIIGYGHIGTQLGILAENLGMKVRYYDVENKLALGNAQPVSTLDELLASADAVTLHVPETAQTKNMIGASQLAKMKPGALLINASRGTVIDIEALYGVLKSGHLGGAAIDVFPKEPKSNKDEFVSPLREFDNVILTPHIGGSTQEAQAAIGMEVIEKLVKYSNNGSTLSAVNFPEVSLPTHIGKHRLLHIHRNEPGILRQVNNIFADGNINISAQYLQTNAEIGYVVTDIDQESSDVAFEKLKAIPGTIRARLLY